MTHQEHFRLLVEKARQHRAVARMLAECDGAPVEALGFHSQQAAEKLLKAAVVALDGEYPYTHRLGELVDLLRSLGSTPPQIVEDLVDLTRFAVEYRYDTYQAGDEVPWDGSRVDSLPGTLAEWVTGLGGQQESE